MITRLSSATNLGNLFTTIDTNADGLGTGAANTIFTDETLQTDTKTASDALISTIRTFAEPKTLYAHIVADYFDAYAATVNGVAADTLTADDISAIKTAISTMPNLEFGQPADAIGVHIKAAMIKPADYTNSATRAQKVQDMIDS